MVHLEKMKLIIIILTLGTYNYICSPSQLGEPGALTNTRGKVNEPGRQRLGRYNNNNNNNKEL